MIPKVIPANDLRTAPSLAYECAASYQTRRVFTIEKFCGLRRAAWSCMTRPLRRFIDHTRTLCDDLVRRDMEIMHGNDVRIGLCCGLILIAAGCHTVQPLADDTTAAPTVPSDAS